LVAPVTNAAVVTAEELRSRADANIKANQLHSPAGDNAVENYLALRAKSPAPQADVETALVDLEPYLVIAVEQATTAAQFDDAARLIALLNRMDETAPALPRLGVALEAARAAAEVTRLGEEERAQSAQILAEQAGREPQAATAAPVAAAPAPPSPTQPASARTSPPTATDATPSPPSAATQMASAAPAPAATPPTARALVSRIAPKYPESALRRRLEGEVEVMARVAPDGSVQQVDVLRSAPQGIFDREAVLAVRRWRYAPGAEASSVRVVVTFKRP